MRNVNKAQWRAGLLLGLSVALLCLACLSAYGWVSHLVRITDMLSLPPFAGWTLRVTLMLVAALGIGAIFARVDLRDLRGCRCAIGFGLGLLASGAVLSSSAIIWCFAQRWCRGPMDLEGVLQLTSFAAHGVLPILVILGVLVSRRLRPGEARWAYVRAKVRLGFVALIGFLLVGPGDGAWAENARLFVAVFAAACSAILFSSAAFMALRLPREGPGYGASERAATAAVAGMMTLAMVAVLGLA